AYETMPLRSVADLVILQRYVRTLLPTIRQPVLVMHARHDHTSGLDNVTLLQHQLPRPPHIELLDDSFHVITLDYDRERVAARVCDFVAGIAGSVGA
ncbi:MAG TPA: hypothetical protein VMJ74_02190, partial [Pseudomonadales bacterium]|nr:hypothetical protein [Pseudomonadales bacterium]